MFKDKYLKYKKKYTELKELFKDKLNNPKIQIPNNLDIKRKHHNMFTLNDTNFTDLVDHGNKEWIILFYSPLCSKSNKLLQILKNKSIDDTHINYGKLNLLNSHIEPHKLNIQDTPSLLGYNKHEYIYDNISELNEEEEPVMQLHLNNFIDKLKLNTVDNNSVTDVSNPPSSLTEDEFISKLSELNDLFDNDDISDQSSDISDDEETDLYSTSMNNPLELKLVDENVVINNTESPTNLYSDLYKLQNEYNSNTQNLNANNLEQLFEQKDNDTGLEGTDTLQTSDMHKNILQFINEHNNPSSDSDNSIEIELTDSGSDFEFEINENDNIDNGKIIELTDDNYDDIITKKGIFVILFYVDWCGHCTKFKPIFEKLSSNSKLNKKINFCKLDCEQYKNIPDKLQIGGYPTILISNNNKVDTYNGPRDYMELEKYLSTLF